MLLKRPLFLPLAGIPGGGTGGAATSSIATEQNKPESSRGCMRWEHYEFQQGQLQGPEPGLGKRPVSIQTEGRID